MNFVNYIILYPPGLRWRSRAYHLEQSTAQNSAVISSLTRGGRSQGAHPLLEPPGQLRLQVLDPKDMVCMIQQTFSWLQVSKLCYWLRQARWASLQARIRNCFWKICSSFSIWYVMVTQNIERWHENWAKIPDPIHSICLLAHLPSTGRGICHKASAARFRLCYGAYLFDAMLVSRAQRQMVPRALKDFRLKEAVIHTLPLVWGKAMLFCFAWNESRYDDKILDDTLKRLEPVFLLSKTEGPSCLTGFRGWNKDFLMGISGGNTGPDWNGTWQWGFNGEEPVLYPLPKRGNPRRWGSRKEQAYKRLCWTAL